MPTYKKVSPTAGLFVLLEVVQIFRRERIYPFRPVTFLLGYVEWKNVGISVGRVACPHRNVPIFGFFHQMGAIQNRNQAAGDSHKPYGTSHFFIRQLHRQIPIWQQAELSRWTHIGFTHQQERIADYRLPMQGGPLHVIAPPRKSHQKR